MVKVTGYVNPGYIAYQEEGGARYYKVSRAKCKDFDHSEAEEPKSRACAVHFFDTSNASFNSFNFDHHIVTSFLPCDTSSMDKLPIELLSRIMIYVVCRTDTKSGQCCPDYFADDFENYAGFWLPIRRTNPQTFGPLQLGMVCRFWRSVSENTPSLWNRIAVDIQHTDELNISKTMRDLSSRLSRSRALPLDVLVFSYGSYSWKYATSNRNIIMVLDELHLHSARFFTISLQLDADFWASLKYYKQSTPRLTHFRLANERHNLGLHYSDVKTFWPSLTHLTLENVHCGPGNLSINSNSLTCLKLISVRIPIPWTTIENAHQLTHLVLDNCTTVHENSVVDLQVPSTVTLSSMYHFEYKPGSNFEDDFMKIFIFPALGVFILEDINYDAGYYIDTLASHSFSTACTNSLRRIALIELERNDRTPPDCNILVNILSSLPSLEYLELGLTNMPHSYFYPFLTRLTMREGAGDATFLPKLYSLKFNSLHGLPWPLIPNIFHRTGSLNQRPLRQLIIKKVLAVNAEFLTIDVMDELINLLDDGIDIQLYDEQGDWINLREAARG